MTHTLHRLFSFWTLSIIVGCARSAPAPQASSTSERQPEPSAAQESPAPDASDSPASDSAASESENGQGGRLFDLFYDPQAFSPDNPKTPAIADGQGGPFGNGTLPLPGGAPLLNDTGHSYRLKSFFGWDLRGAEGIYGPRYHNKKYVLDINLLSPEHTAESLTRLFTQGDEELGLPSYQTVLTEDEIATVVRFVMDVRDGRLPNPDMSWTLSEGTPGSYRLNTGADPSRGKQLFAERCATCHGSDGTKLLFDDDEYSLGTHARQKAYEDWFKILNGQPGTLMKRFVTGTGPEMGQQILDILAALCDRTEFQQGAATSADVPNGDPRCGEYLR